MLEDLVPADADGGIRLSQEIEGDGAAVFEAATGHGLEGIICKDKTKPYRSERGGEWIKVKVISSEGFAIVGYERSVAALGGIGRLLLAADGKARRRAPGRQHGRKKRPEVTWLRPELVAEVEFRAWTKDGKLRHASYKGLRDAADASDIFEI